MLLSQSPGWLRDGLRVYAIGDIHGRLDLLDNMIEQITLDRQEHPVSLSCEVYVGDYVDRGPHSAGVIERLEERARTNPLYRLAGNHEAMMLSALDDPGAVSRWLVAGGAAAALSYGVPPPDSSADPAELESFRLALNAAMPPHHLAFLQDLRFSVRIDGYFFTHAGVRPGVPLSQQSPDDLMWIRGDFLHSDEDFGATIVHGHTKSTQPVVRPNRISIDTGAYASGRLTCLVVEKDQFRFLTAV